jgi:hypothetical protein
MGCLEGRGVPALYIERTVFKGPVLDYWCTNLEYKRLYGFEG